ncbi:hypothetical protein K492DRAFT_172090 [Lichtheimia hyalospora FSU 10163]|nr:hypothetical protein K492DRAFT_172090 [Lichtheimia hyalospora FSU 10163]
MPTNYMPPNARPPPPGAAMHGMGPGPVGRPPAITGAPAGGDAENLTTLFVGAIPAGVNDGWIEKLLTTTGKLRHWKRMKDPSGKPKGFGFVEYEDPDSVLRTLRVLGGEENTHQGLTLTAMDGSQVQKKLIVKADDKVRNHLDQYKQTRMETNNDDEEDQKALKIVYACVDAINKGLQPEEYENGAATTTGENGGAGGATEESDANDMLSRDLAFFKERAAQRDQERRSESVERDKRSRNRSPDSDYSRRRRSQGRHGRSHDFVRGATEFGHPEEEEDISDEELERRREERREKELEIAFKQKEKEVEAEEARNRRDYERRLQRLKEHERRYEHNREYEAKRLAEWDDEVEEQRGEELFYSNRSRWRLDRSGIRAHLDKEDENDRRLEAQEIEERRRAEEREREKQSASATPHMDENTPKIALKPTKLNLTVPIKRISAIGGGEEDDDDDEAGRKRRVLVPLEYDDDDVTYDDSSNVDPEERVRKIKELIDSIPSSEQELWAWPVKWDQVDEDLVNEKLKPFISKKVLEILGTEEEEFVGFILDFVRRRQSPDILTKELEMTLDTEALVFVMKLWRALIFETERKSRKL